MVSSCNYMLLLLLRLLLLLLLLMMLWLHSMPVHRKGRISVEVLKAVLMQDLVVKILPDIELAWRGDKPLLVLLRVIAGMALSQAYMFVELYAAAAVVVVVAVDGKDLSLSQHQLLPSNWLRSL